MSGYRFPEHGTVAELLKVLRHRGTAHGWANINAVNGTFMQKAFRLHKDELISDLKKMPPGDTIRFYWRDRADGNDYGAAWVERTVFIGRAQP